MTLLLTLSIIGVIFYSTCAVLAYGLTLAYFQQHWPDIAEVRDRNIARVVAIGGPAGLLVALMEGKGWPYGLQWRAIDSEWAKKRKGVT